jgi:hypothetical protein
MRNILFTKFLILVFLPLIYSQYEYGFDICESDGRIMGKLNILEDTSSVFIGYRAGINNNETSSFGGNTFLGFEAGEYNTFGGGNTFVGFRAGKENTNNILLDPFLGSSNTFLGYSAGQNNTSGYFNTIIGRSAGYNNESGIQNTLIGRLAGAGNLSGSNNTIIGTSAGIRSNGSYNVIIGNGAGSMLINSNGNVMIGYNSGGSEIGSNKLYIENSNSTTPLIYGEFDSDMIQINGSLHLRDAFQLTPNPPPSGTCSQNGLMLYGTNHELYLCKSGVWKQVLTN